MRVVAKAPFVEAVSGYSRKLAPDHALKPSAVLIPVIETPDGLSLVFTLRPAELGVHGGQVSFPGGRVEPGDDDRWATALRESEEELGIAPESVTRVGQLDDYRTVTGYHVTPCVGLLTMPQAFRPCPREVEEVFDVPLARLADPTELRTMQLGSGERTKRVFFYLGGEHIIWGATGAIVSSLLDVLRHALEHLEAD